MANLIFNGSVQDVAQVTESTASGTWVTGEKAWATIGTSTVEITLGATVTTTQVVAALSAAINASDTTTGLADDETRNIGGQTRGEFRDVVASVSSSTITLTSATPGVDFDVTFGDDSTSGALSAASTTTTATGKNWFNNDDNWNGGTAPSSGDIAVFTDSSISCTRGLDTITNFDGVTRTGTYTGDIGLRKTNTTHVGYSYPEYRTRFLRCNKATDGAIIRIGDGTGSSQGITNIDNYQHDANYYINDTAPVPSNSLYPIEIISDYGGAGGGVDITIQSGYVDIGERNGDGSSGFGCEIEHVRVWGGGARIEGAVEPSSELIIYGGVVETYMALTNFTADLILEGGSLTHHTGACPGLTIGNGSTVDYRSETGPSGDLEIMSGGSLTFDNDQQTKVMTDIDIRIHDGASFSDIRGVAVPSGTGEYHFLNCNTTENTVLPKNYSYAPTAL
jgi:hypothetical protein